jgi:hypothetical protein
LLRSRREPPKIAVQAIFYLANCQSSPEIVVFAAQSGAKTYKCNRLLGVGVGYGILERQCGKYRRWFYRVRGLDFRTATPDT